MLKTAHAVNTSDSYTITLGCAMSQVSEIMDVMTVFGCKNVVPIFWYKTNQQQVGQVYWSLAVEVFVQGQYSSGGRINTHFSKDPLQRHNHFSGPRLMKYLKHSMTEHMGKNVNDHEKPGYVIQNLLRPCMTPGGTVLIIGTGAGGDLRGCIEEGWNVAGIEMDPDQYKAVVSLMTTYNVVQAQLEDKNAKAASRLRLGGPKVDVAPADEECKACGMFCKGTATCDSCGSKLCPDCDKDGECVECKDKLPASEPVDKPAGGISSSESEAKPDAE